MVVAAGMGLLLEPQPVEAVDGNLSGAGLRKTRETKALSLDRLSVGSIATQGQCSGNAAHQAPGGAIRFRARLTESGRDDRLCRILTNHLPQGITASSIET